MKDAVYNEKMKTRRIVLISALLLSVGLAALAASGQTKKKNVKDLPPQYRKWIEQDVAYIITPKERDVFLQLDSDRDREIFTTAFWRQRDPTPGTPKNEFKDEHYRRIAYANQWYGRDTPTPGWRTDMGRIYVILGEPKAVEKYENLYDVFPTQIWFYEGMAEYGTPNAFNVVFFKPSGIPEYRLYSPLQYGPQALLIHYNGDMTDYMSAYSKLAQIEPAIAGISMSLVPGESLDTERPSISSEILLHQRIPAAPYEKVKDDYAEKLLRYKDIIEVDYTSNYIRNESLLAVVRDGNGQSYVHYAIEPEKLNFEGNEKGFHAEMEINGKVALADNPTRTIYQFDRLVPFDVSPDQMGKIKAKLFSYQDLFPLIPGRYKVNFLWKNRVSREFSSIEADILVPGAGAFSMTAPVVGNRADKNSRYKGTAKSFLLNDIQLVPSPRNDFQVGDTLYFFFQLNGLPADIKAGGRLEYAFLKEGQPFKSSSRAIAEIADPSNIFEEFPLTDFPPAQYQVRITVRAADKSEKLSSQFRFYITNMMSLPRPFVLSQPQPPSNDASVVNILGLQYLNNEEPAKARPLLEAAYRRDPAQTKYALDFARLLLAAKDYVGVKGVVAPFLADERKWDVLQLAGQAAQSLGELAPAIDFYKSYLNHFGANISILNAIGECYLSAGGPADALVAWEKSLQLNPNQPDLKARVQTLKEREKEKVKK
jgi:GWxTD domain-containing protein